MKKEKDKKHCYVCGIENTKDLTKYKNVWIKTKGNHVKYDDAYICKDCQYRILKYDNTIIQEIRKKVYNDLAHENWERIKLGNPIPLSKTTELIDKVIEYTICAMDKKNGKNK